MMIAYHAGQTDITDWDEIPYDGLLDKQAKVMNHELLSGEDGAEGKARIYLGLAGSSRALCDMLPGAGSPLSGGRLPTTRADLSGYFRGELPAPVVASGITHCHCRHDNMAPAFEIAATVLHPTRDRS